MQHSGAPHTQVFYYQIGSASTALASGVFFTATGTATGTLTATGALVSGGVATFDVPRAIRFTSSVDLSTITFTVRGTDGYGAAQTVSILGPTGNTFGNNGSFRETLVTFKTVITASTTNTTGTTAFAIGTSDTYGLPYFLTNAGRGVGAWINGALATVPATFTAGFTATGTTTATTADVRGTVTLATLVLANDARFITIGFITPNVGLTESQDTKVRTFGATPFTV